MAKYYTTTEELTSIANAIRAKSGSSSNLIYPSGFVSEIGNISGDVWDGFGANPEFVQTIYNESITLADTNWENVTLTTSDQTIQNHIKIIDLSQSTNILLNWDYDYVIVGEGTIYMAYLTEVYPAILTTHLRIAYFATTYNEYLTAILANLQNKVVTYLVRTNNTLYKNTSNQLAHQQASAGIGYTPQYQPSFDISHGLYSVYVPRIDARILDSYFPQNTVDNVDKNNTTCTFTWKLYRYKKHSTALSRLLTSSYNKTLEEYAIYNSQQA